MSVELTGASHGKSLVTRERTLVMCSMHKHKENTFNVFQCQHGGNTCDLTPHNLKLDSCVLQLSGCNCYTKNKDETKTPDRIQNTECFPCYVDEQQWPLCDSVSPTTVHNPPGEMGW